VNVATNIQYQPFGAPKSWSFGNGAAYARAFDLDGRIGSYPFGAAFQGLGYDLADRTTTFTTATSKSIGYDKLDRLTGFVAGTTNLSYQYDADGNRSQFKNGMAIGTDNYPATSNRLSSITGTGAESYGYDAAGNITTLAGKTLTYDARGRLKTLTSGTSSWSYGLNGLGQRVTKAGTGFTGTLPFVYDEQGHLIGEYTSTGVLTQETVYLGDTPVAILQTSATFYIQADQLNTPRVILNSANQQRWRWDLSEPFGNNAPNENPAALGTFKYNLRFPGQYADTETGLNYNFFRDYYSKTGGYIESDPIGLLGGINTYSYVENGPLTFTDPYGLQVAVPAIPSSGVAAGGAISWGTNQGSQSDSSNNALFPDAGKKPGWRLSDLFPGWIQQQDAGDDVKVPGCPTEADGFKPPKNWDGSRVKNPNGPGWGYPDRKGNVWVPTALSNGV
jgi:RHS repeat-associated protein